MSEIRVLAVPGSLRRASYNRKVAESLHLLAPTGMSVTVYDDLGRLPHYNEDLDQDDPPSVVRTLRERIAAADAVFWAFPEFNHSVPGVLKNLVDWASHPLDKAPLVGKVSAIAVATQGHGGHRGMAELARILRDLGGFVVPAPEVCVQRAHERLAVDETGAVRFVDEKIRAALQLLLKSLDRAARDDVGARTAAPWRDVFASRRWPS
jgi:chromate reductase